MFWTGPAYMDASIDASLSAPKLSGTWKAAGPFLLEGGVLSATAAAARARRFGRGRDASADERREPRRVTCSTR